MSPTTSRHTTSRPTVPADDRRASLRRRIVTTVISLGLALLVTGCESTEVRAPTTSLPPADAGTPPTPTPPVPPPPLVLDAGSLTPPPLAFDAGLAGPLPQPPPNMPPVVANDAFISSRLQAAGAPGAAMAIVKHGTIVWTKGYGYADLQAGRPVTPDTIFLLASISKTFTGAALLQLMENSPGGLSLLDADVSGSLGFVLRNPHFPNAPITYRMLLTHTSSLVDGDNFTNLSQELPGDSSVPLASFLAQYIQDPSNWDTSPPGTAFSYSNGATALVGHIVERVSGMNLQQYSARFIFGPLGMTESSWFLSGLNPSRIAMPYVIEGGGYRATGQYGFPDYPDGQLRTSARQLARYLIALAGDGSLGGARLLRPGTIAEMRRPQFGPGQPYQGLVVFSVTANGVPHIGHNGATSGCSTDMWFDPATGAGFITLTNSNAYIGGSDAEQSALYEIHDELARMAAAIP